MENVILEQIKSSLLDIVGKIDRGECKISSSGLTEVLGVIKKYSDTSRELTKTEASEYLHVSKSTFDRLVRKGDIPRGHKTRRNRILTWSTSDLDKVL